ncbi:hypothetical protein AB1Y20_008746 [Prymnesium parvum]|uniref:Uncharacterized protein n=1 Tax=Prymnesium parvum TaxID=97485 RepID=A0AB34ISI0_PRYPA
MTPSSMPQFVTMPWASSCGGRGGDSTSRSFTMSDVNRFLSSDPSSSEQSGGSFDSEHSTAETEIHTSSGVPECLRNESSADNSASLTDDLEDSSDDDDEGYSPKPQWAPPTARRLVRGPRFTTLTGG